MKMKIAAFNAKNLGIRKVTDKKVVHYLTEIVSRYSVVLMIEVMDKSGAAMKELFRELNSSNAASPYCMTASSPLGRDTYKERFVCFYRAADVTLMDRHQYEDDQPGDVDVFAREPFMLRFSCPSTKVKDLVLVPVHTKPTDTLKELDELHDVVTAIRKKWGTDKIMILGDFNADGRYLSKRKKDKLRLCSADYHWLIDDDVDTTTSNSNDHTYDRYEDEINKRNNLENDFVILKKDVDSAYLVKADLEDKVGALTDEINFLRNVYEEELRELQAGIRDTSVVLQMDNNRSLNMESIVAEVKGQYEDIAARSREEAEAWYKRRVDQMSVQARQYGDELRLVKGEVGDVNRLISRLQSEIEAVKAQRGGLENQLIEAEERGELAVKEAKARTRDLEDALQRAKQDMARQLREYQDLMNLKLALDIEIATYRKLLEGEEDRLGQQSILNIQTFSNSSTKSTNGYHSISSSAAPKLLIKTTETRDSSRYSSH